MTTDMIRRPFRKDCVYKNEQNCHYTKDTLFPESYTRNAWGNELYETLVSFQKKTPSSVEPHCLLRVAGTSVYVCCVRSVASPSLEAILYSITKRKCCCNIVSMEIIVLKSDMQLLFPPYH